MYRNEKKKASKKKQINPGIYTAEVMSIGFDDNYVDNTAIRVTYKLTDDNGEEYEFFETFWYVDENERTDEFFQHLNSIGISEEEFEKYEGCIERVTIKKNISGNKALPSIVQRDFVSSFDDEDKA